MPSRQNRHWQNLNWQNRNGLSLIEVLLAMSLVAVIMGMLGIVMRSQMRMMDTRRTGIQEAQLARTVLRMISNDLKAAVNTVNESAGGETGVVSDEEAGLTGTDDTATGTTSTATDTTSDDTSEAIDPLLQTSPGLYGNASEVRFDIVRSPRAQSFNELVEFATADELARPFSGFQSVAYLVGPSPDNAGGIDAIVKQLGLSPASSSNQPATSGLIRQVMDQATRSYVLEFGDLTTLDAYSQMIAPEVSALQFQYFDGTQWLPDWDSEQQGGLPVAVQIAVSISTIGVDDDGESAVRGITAIADGSSSDNVFRTTVFLPTSWKTDQNDQAF